MKKILYSSLLSLFLLIWVDSLNAQATEIWYIRNNPPEPWGGGWAPDPDDNIDEMNDVFGVGGWNSGYYSSVDPLEAFGATSKYVFMEGGDSHASELNTFYSANISLIEDWVAAGGKLFVEAAPNEGGDIALGFGGGTLDYPSYSSNGDALFVDHPIFLGPNLPVGTAWTGPYFGHATIDFDCANVLIENEVGKAVLVEINWGSGTAIFGGMTLSSWHDPQPHGTNLKLNIHEYMITAEPFFVSTTFLYEDSVYCQYEIDPLPIFDPGSEPGLFESAPAGMVIDPVTGLVDLDASLPGVYSITNTVTIAGCDFFSEFEMTISESPIADAGPDQSICKGTNALLEGSGGATYMWTPPVYLDDPTLASPTVIAPPTNVFYQMIAYNTDGCSDTDDVTVFLYPDPIIDAGSDATITLGSFTELNATGAVGYSWEPAESLSNALISNPTAYPEDTTVYVVTGTDLNGCIGTDTVVVYVVTKSDIATPTAFTPNNDGLNDVFTPSFMGLGTVTDFTIFNRWGKQIFYSGDPNIGWDGTLNGLEQEVGTYIVIIHGVDQFAGFVSRTTTLTLLR